MGGFRFLEHIGEAGIEAWGRDMGDAFAQAALGLGAMMVGRGVVEERGAREVAVAAADGAALLVGWLNELLYLFEVEGWLFSRFAIAEISDTSLRARCFGEPYDAARHRLRLGVKAATYHGVQVSGNGEWRVRVIVDV